MSQVTTDILLTEGEGKGNDKSEKVICKMRDTDHCFFWALRTLWLYKNT